MPDLSDAASSSAASARTGPPGVPTPVEGPPARSPNPWRRAWLTGLSTWAAAEVMYLLVNAMVWMTRSEAGPPLSGYLEVWNRWDTGHYVAIATTGYNPNNENPAFFPLYPMVMRILDPVLPGDMLMAGLTVASVACIVALAVIYRLVDDLFEPDVAQRTTMYLMAFPFAFYLVAVYNESLFLALSVASLYYMRRGNWWYAGALAGFAGATRQAGVLLAMAFAVEYLRQRDWQWRRIRLDALAVGLVPLGVVAFMIYSGEALGDPLRFVHIQTFWDRELRAPWVGTAGAIEQMSGPLREGQFFHLAVVLNMIDLIAVPATIALLVLSVVGPWRLGPQSWYLTTFASAVFLMVLLTPIGRGLPPLHGVPRYALEILPAFMVVARMGANRSAERFYLFPAIGVQATLLLSFFYNIWLS